MSAKKTVVQQSRKYLIAAISLSAEQKKRYGDIYDAFHAEPRRGILVGGRHTTLSRTAPTLRDKHGK